MFAKLAFSIGLIGALSIGTVAAQTTSPDTTSVARDPTMGDPGAKPAPRKRVRTKVPADKPGPGATTGNAPDRALAGGGGR